MDFALHRGKPKLDTGFAACCNNDHVLSPDGLSVGLSHGTAEDGWSGCTPCLSPAESPADTPHRPQATSTAGLGRVHPGLLRGQNGEFDIYTIPVEGGEETRLTFAPGLSDGPNTRRTESRSGSTPCAAA